MATADTPVILKAANAARIADMSARKFRYRVSDGQLPPPVRIEGLIRRDRQVVVPAHRQRTWPWRPH